MEIPRYSGCYIAIPVPEQFHPEYRKLLYEVGRIAPNLRLDKPDNPHITVLHMGRVKEEDLSFVKHVTLDETREMSSAQLSIGGRGYFSDRDSNRPNVLYLKVKSPPELVRTHNALRNRLHLYMGGQYFGYTPHVTVAFVDSLSGEESFLGKKPIKRLLDGVSWTFNLSELVLFGKDLELDNPRGSQRLAVYPIRTE